MSELRVDTINEATSGTGTTISKLTNPNQPFRNLIINGDMAIAQRSTSAVAVNNTNNTLDRFRGIDVNSGGAYTTEQYSLTASEEATTGQQFAMKANVTSADTSIAAAHYAALFTNVEAQFCKSLLYGTSAAKSVTISFWVKSNLTGIFCLAFYKDDSTTLFCTKEYTINSADTWEKKIITITPTEGSTSLITSSSGNIVLDNGVGVSLYWGLAAGSNYHGSKDVWETGTLFTSNQTNFLSSTSNNFYLTGVQLEVGDIATDFEHLPFDVQERRCFRYFQTLHLTSNSIKVAASTSTTAAHMDFEYPNGEMRTSPTITLPAAGNSSGTTAFLTAVGAYPSTIGSHVAQTVTEIHTRISGSGYSANLGAGYALLFYSNGTNTFKMDAEL